MNFIRIIIFICLNITFYSVSFCQQSKPFKDTRELYASTKQVNQFFRRFNNEESVEGKRYYPKDSAYRSPATRGKYLNMLFDNQNKLVSSELKNQFISEVIAKSSFIEFHGGNWFAEADASFLWNGKQEKLKLFLQLQKEKVGSKWIISKVNFAPFDRLYEKDTTGSKYFLHPLSHELDFMNLHKAIENNKDNIEDYTGSDFLLDHLTMFVQEVKKGNLKFVSVSDVKFHFFQVNNWYFELSQFNRSGNNSGWLISGLTRANEKEKDQIRNYIYNPK